jgi:putative aminopeptidase FrvX
MSKLKIQLDPMIDFLARLLERPSPTGYTVEAITFIEDSFRALKIKDLQIERTTKGALRLFWKGELDGTTRGVTAHTDTLGLMVKEIKGSGRLKVTTLGGFPGNLVEGEGVTVRTFDDRRYRGTVLLSNPSVHVNENLRTTERRIENMEIRLDARTHSAAETRALGIDIGDFIFLDPRVEVTDTGFIRSRHLDDKAGVAAIYGALAAMGKARQRPAHDAHILIANYEEVGHGGAAGLPHDLHELLTIDMGAIGDGQNSDEFSVSICAKDSGGPYHFEMTAKMRRLAMQHDIPYKVDIYPMYASDGTSWWRAGGGGRVALIGPGIDASHGYERTHSESLEHTAHLIACYLLDEDVKT